MQMHDNACWIRKRGKKRSPAANWYELKTTKRRPAHVCRLHPLANMPPFCFQSDFALPTMSLLKCDVMYRAVGASIYHERVLCVHTLKLNNGYLYDEIV